MSSNAKAHLTIDCGNAAFEEPGQELARILRELADKVEHRVVADESESIPVADLNGNKVGRFEYEPDDG